MDDFEYGWFDWILAGSNTSECCLIALEGNIYDITEFVPLHPGSPESILMESGGEVTQIFNDIGHSQTARNTSKEYLVSSAIAAPRSKNNFKLGRLYNKRQLELRKRAIMAQKLGEMFCGGTDEPIVKKCSFVCFESIPFLCLKIDKPNPLLLKRGISNLCLDANQVVLSHCTKEWLQMQQ